MRRGVNVADMALEASVLSHDANVGLYTDVTAKMSQRKNKKNKHNEHCFLFLKKFGWVSKEAGRLLPNIFARS